MLQNTLEKTKNRFGLRVWFVMKGFPLLKHLYFGQEYIWFGFGEPSIIIDMKLKYSIIGKDYLFYT